MACTVCIPRRHYEVLAARSKGTRGVLANLINLRLGDVLPVRPTGAVRIDYTDDGAGECVVLIHSSVSGNRQWRALIDELCGSYRIIAPNLFGYGETTPWSGTSPQSLHAQASLVVALCEEVEGPIHLAGHSFGGTVAMKAASLLGQRVGKLVLLEPNPFHLLEQHGRTEALTECLALREHVNHFGSRGDWTTVAQRFADYWLGDGSWAAMPEKRRQAFASSLPPNFHEWDAVMGEQSTVEELKRIHAKTLVVSAADSRRPILEIVEILALACTDWEFERLPEGGHMAPLTRPALINPLVRRFLDADPR